MTTETKPQTHQIGKFVTVVLLIVLASIILAMTATVGQAVVGAITVSTLLTLMMAIWL